MCPICLISNYWDSKSIPNWTMKSIINQKQHLGTLFQYIFELYPEDCIFVHISWVLRGIPICPLYFVDIICSIELKLKNRGVVFQTELLQYKVATTH